MSQINSEIDSIQSDNSLSIMGYYTPCTINHVDDNTGLGGIYNQRTNTGVVPNGSPINIANVRVIGNGVSYDPTTASVLANRAGIYLFIWTVLANIANEGNADNIIIALENSNGDQYALSGNVGPGGTPATLVTGSTAVDLPAGANINLVNRSETPINLVTAISANSTYSYSASLTVVRISD